MPRSLSSDRLARLVYAVFLAAGAIAPFLALTASSYWFDELASLFMIDRDSGWSEAFFGRISRDFHPPLFYLTLRAWLLAVGETLVTPRLLNALIGLALLAFLFVWHRRRFSLTTALFATAAVAFGYGYMVYAGEARSYMLVFLLGAAQFALVWRGLFESPRAARLPARFWAAFGLVGLLLSLTHYYALLLTGGAYALLLIARRNRGDRALVMLLGLATLALLALYVHWSTARAILDIGDTWITNDWRSFVSGTWLYLWRGLGGGLGLPLFFIGLGLGVAAACLVTRRYRLLGEIAAHLAPAAFLAGFVVAAGIAISLAVAPNFTERNLQVLWPSLWMSLGYLFHRGETLLGARREILLHGLAVLALAGALPFAWVMQQPHKEEWRASARFVAAQEGCRGAPLPIAFGARPLANPHYRPLAAFAYGYYLPDAAAYDLRPTPSDALAGGRPPALLREVLADDARRCPVVLWSVHALDRAAVEALAAKLAAATGGPLEIVEFNHQHLWPWTGGWLWRREAPAHTKTFVLLALEHE